MKLVVAIISPHKLDTVLEALYGSKVNLVTITEVLGHGFQKGVEEVYRGVKESSDIQRKLRLEIAVNDDFLETTIQSIVKGAKTGEIGDGKVFVLDLKDCIRIRTEERGSSAIG